MTVFNSPHNLRRIGFYGKQILLPKNPRTNICSECRRRYPEELKRQTCLHHDFYDESDPLEGIRELCASCHMKYHHHIQPKRHLMKTKLKISRSMQGHKHSEATKQKISLSMKRYHQKKHGDLDYD